MDGRIDGKFIIKQGGITQGIASELGLTRAECKQISGSIWTQVINEFNNEQNMNVQNNRDAAPNADNNYTVHKNAIITFSKECWSKIVGLINSALGKNIQVEDAEQPKQTNQSESTSNDVTTKNEQNLQSAYNELKSMTGLFVQKYNLDENKFAKSLEDSYRAILGSLPDTLCDTADLAMNVLMNTFKKLMPGEEREAVKNAVIEIAQHWKDVENANIGGILCKDIISSDEKIEEVVNLYTQDLPIEEDLDIREDSFYLPTSEEIESAKKAIIENLSNINLPRGTDIKQLHNILSSMNINNLNFPMRKLSLGDIENVILLEAMKEISPNTDINELRKLSIKNIANISPNETIASVKVSELNDKFIDDLINIKEVAPPAKFRAKIEKAINVLKEELPNLTNEELKTLGITPEKRDRLLSYISNVLYDNTHGSGQAVGRWIVISTNWPYSSDISETVALLIHEANHCDEEYLSQNPDLSDKGNYRFQTQDGKPYNNRYSNTKEEEGSCETLSMLLSAILIQKGCIPDFVRYEQDNVSSYVDSEGKPAPQLKNYIYSFKNCYTNYPEDLNGNLTVRHSLEEDGVILSEEERQQTISIQSGDIIKIGNEEYPIGRGQFLLSPLDSAPIFQLVGIDGCKFDNLVFDDVLPNQTEMDLMARRTLNENDRNRMNGNYIDVVVIRNEKEIYKGKCYNG